MLSFRPGGRTCGVPGVEFASAPSPSGDSSGSGTRAVRNSSFPERAFPRGGWGPAPRLGYTCGMSAKCVSCPFVSRPCSLTEQTPA